ncbi:MAG: DUF4874 domain-containing protein [Bacteroidetes bacterium]|nr:DUF4874 domain-containing protein [Bacteroidota bacterium]
MKNNNYSRRNTRTYCFLGLTILGASLFLAFCKKGSAENGLTPNVLTFSVPVDTTIYLTGIYAGGPNSSSPGNPDRGFRAEIMINAKTLKGVFDGADYSNNYGDIILKHLSSETPLHNLSDSITLIQQYIYLSDEALTSLSTQTLTNIQYILNELKRVKVKAVLRFAYDDGVKYDAFSGLPYNSATIQTHLNQLAPIISQNLGCIAVLQVGFVGNWGEWGGNFNFTDSNPLETALILKEVLKALPADRVANVRYTWIKNNAKTVQSPVNRITDAEYKRLGYHNDFFTGGIKDLGADYVPGSATYNQCVSETKFQKAWMDGEMPYYTEGTDKYAFGPVIINPWTVVKIFSECRYTSFSISHHNMEYGGSKNTNVLYWRNNSFTLRDFVNNNIGKAPVDSAYFRTATGNYVSRSFFDYFKDHLGYRLMLKNFSYSKPLSTSSSFNIQFDITNLGFSNPINPRPVYVALINNATNAVTTYPLNVDTQSWDVATAIHSIA